jgi:hypothetical protein
MCPKCKGFSERIRIEKPYELDDLADQIRDTITMGYFVSLEATVAGDRSKQNLPC